MGMKKIKKLVATTGKYTVNGVEKSRYVNVGSMFKDDADGRISLKLDSIPVGDGWGGWLSVYDLEERDAQPAGQGQAQVNVGAPPVPASFDDDIPF